MRTDALIDILARDTSRGPSAFQVLTLAVLASLALATGLMLATMGLRPEPATAAAHPEVWLKTAFVTVLVLGAGSAALRAGQPGRSGRGGLAAVAAAAAVMVALAARDLATLPLDDWVARVFGTNWLFCLASVPLLGLPAMAVLVLGLRRLAPTDLATAGAIVGLAGGAVGAFAYALHCTDDAAPFVATWYVIAIAVTTLIGRLVGPRLLRW